MKITIVRMTRREYMQQRQEEQEAADAQQTMLYIALILVFAMLFWWLSRRVRRFRWTWYRWFVRPGMKM